jgi:hypothetical protein
VRTRQVTKLARKLRLIFVQQHRPGHYVDILVEKQPDICPSELSDWQHDHPNAFQHGWRLHLGWVEETATTFQPRTWEDVK